MNDDDGVSSTGDGGLSDENASLVGFGEGANSTISGPVSTAANVNVNKMPFISRQSSGAGGLNRTSSSSGQAYTPQPTLQSAGAIPPSSPSPAGSNTPQGLDEEAALNLGMAQELGQDDARMVDGITFDDDVVDTTVRAPQAVGSSGGNLP